MDINTAYDSLSQQLKISSGLISGGSGSSNSGTTTSDSSSSSTSDSTSWSQLALSLTDTQSQYLSPILAYKAQNEALQEQLTKTLAAKLEELDIDASETITLGRDAEGNIVVEGDNINKKALEKLFRDTPVLTEAFNTLADNSTMLRTMTSQQAGSLVRTNGYSAYLQQLNSSTTSSSFYMSMLNGVSSTYFN